MSSWWIGHHQFWIASLLSLTWIYRLAFNLATAKTEYCVEKEIFVTKPVRIADNREIHEYDFRLSKFSFKRNKSETEPSGSGSEIELELSPGNSKQQLDTTESEKQIGQSSDIHVNVDQHVNGSDDSEPLLSNYE